MSTDTNQEVQHGAAGESSDRGETASGATPGQSTSGSSADVPLDGSGVDVTGNAPVHGDEHVKRDSRRDGTNAFGEHARTSTRLGMLERRVNRVEERLECHVTDDDRHMPGTIEATTRARCSVCTSPADVEVETNGVTTHACDEHEMQVRRDALRAPRSSEASTCECGGHTSDGIPGTHSDKCPKSPVYKARERDAACESSLDAVYKSIVGPAPRTGEAPLADSVRAYLRVRDAASDGAAIAEARARMAEALDVEERRSEADQSGDADDAEREHFARIAAEVEVRRLIDLNVRLTDMLNGAASVCQDFACRLGATGTSIEYTKDEGRSYWSPEANQPGPRRDRGVRGGAR